MTSHFVPLQRVPVPARAPRPRPTAHRGSRTRTATRSRSRSQSRIALCVLLVIVLLEAVLLLSPERLLLDPLQATTLGKQVTGYATLGLMVFSMTFGMLRRTAVLASHQRTFNELHQFGGFLLLLLLAGHLGEAPRGFLLYTFHALAVALGAGALRPVLGTRVPKRLSTALLVLHITLSCAVAVAALVHLYLVYAYTA